VAWQIFSLILFETEAENPYCDVKHFGPDVFDLKIWRESAEW
jgi:hypothetical protein